MSRRPTLAPATWREVLSGTDRLALAEEGFLHIRAAADERALQAMRAAWVRCLQESAEPVFAKARGNNDGPSGLEKEPAFLHCLEHPYVMSAVAQVLDGDVALAAFRGRDPRAGSGQQARSISARAGDVIVFSAHLWHAGSENLSGAPRRIAMAHFGRREAIESYARAMDGHGAYE